MKQHNPMKILWVHNFGAAGGFFMKDIKQVSEWNGDWKIESLDFPVSPRLRDLPKLIKEVRRAASYCDLVHAQFGSLVGFCSAFSGKPLITTIRGSDYYHYPAPNFIGQLGSCLRQLLSYVAMIRSTAIICMSERNKSEIRNMLFLNNKCVQVVSDPAGLEFWPVTTAELQKSENKTRFRLFVGSLHFDNPIKRVGLIASAVEVCRDLGLNIELVTLSGAPRSEVRASMAKCHAVVLASVYEGFPNVVKEGLLLGLPFIATDVSDLKSLALISGRGIIVDSSRLGLACGMIEAYYSFHLKASGGRAEFAKFWPAVAARKLQASYLQIKSSEK